MNPVNELKSIFEQIRKKMSAISIGNILSSGLTMSQASILIEIGTHRGLSLKDLSSLIELDNSTVSRSVNQLVEKGLVLRHTTPNDRRMVEIFLSDEGKLLFDKMRQTNEEQYEQLIRHIPAEKLNSFIESAALLLMALEQSEAESEQ